SSQVAGDSTLQNLERKARHLELYRNRSQAHSRSSRIDLRNNIDARLAAPPLRHHAGATAPARRSAIAFNAASALAPSGPPAWAMSGRPPPPWPPSAAAPALTRSTALYFAVRSSVTPTTMPALPSS